MGGQPQPQQNKTRKERKKGGKKAKEKVVSQLDVIGRRVGLRGVGERNWGEEEEEEQEQEEKDRAP